MPTTLLVDPQNEPTLKKRKTKQKKHYQLYLYILSCWLKSQLIKYQHPFGLRENDFWLLGK